MQTVKLNLIPGSVLPVVNVSQYDEKRQFALQVHEGATAYSLTGKDVQIRGTKPDGNGFAYDATDGVVSVSGNTVTISTTQQMTAVGGQTMAELRITSGDTILGTLNFILMVEPSALSDDTPISDTDIPAIERDFEAALEEAQEAAETATTQAGIATTKAGEAASSATSAAGSATTASSAATTATTKAGEASTSATTASTAATAAAADSLKAEGWAVGEQGGQPVGPTSPYYQNNAAYYAAQAGQYATGGLIFKGSVAFANIPTTGMVNGDMYNITDDFTTDSRFIEGAGVAVKAGADIAFVAGSVNKWDILALGGGSGVPAGGTTDQVLAKNSNTDGDTKWMNIPSRTAGLLRFTRPEAGLYTGGSSYYYVDLGDVYYKTVFELYVGRTDEGLNKYRISGRGVYAGSPPYIAIINYNEDPRTILRAPQKFYYAPNNHLIARVTGYTYLWLESHGLATGSMVILENGLPDGSIEIPVRNLAVDHYYAGDTFYYSMSFEYAHGLTANSRGGKFGFSTNHDSQTRITVPIRLDKQIDYGTVTGMVLTRRSSESTEADRTMLITWPGYNWVSAIATTITPKFTGDAREITIDFEFPQIANMPTGSIVYIVGNQYYDGVQFT